MNTAVHAALVLVRPQISFWIEVKQKFLVSKFELNYLKHSLEQLVLFLYYFEYLHTSVAVMH